MAIAILLALCIYLAYSAGYLGTVPGEDGTWKALYKRTDEEKDNLTMILEAEEDESEKLRNECLALDASRDEWKLKYLQKVAALDALQSRKEVLESEYNETLIEKRQLESQYADQVQATQIAENKSDQLSTELTMAVEKQDKWHSLYNASQENLTHLMSSYKQKQEELASMTDSRDEWKALYNNMKESRDEWESRYTDVKSNYDDLTTDYEELEEAHSILSMDYDSLSNQYTYLNSQNSVLKSDLNRIRADFSILNSSYLTLQDKYDQLNTTYGQYAETYTRLNSSYWDLNQSYANLHSLHLSLLNDYNSLLTNYSNLQADYEQLELDYESLGDDQKWLILFFEDYLNWYGVRTGMDQNTMEIITPEDPVVSAQSADIVAYPDGELSWTDMNYLNSWVGNNIAYNHDTAVWCPYSHTDRFEYWQSPNRTIMEGRGDCEDQANLLLSLFLAEQDVGYAYVALVDFSDDTGHAVVFINVEGDNMFIYDPTFDSAWFFGLLTTGGWKSDGCGSETAKIAEYEMKAGRSIDRIRAVYNDKTYQSFSTMQEFYDWF